MIFRLSSHFQMYFIYHHRRQSTRSYVREIITGSKQRIEFKRLGSNSTSVSNACTWSSTIPMSCMLARVYFNTCMHQCMQWVVIPIVSSMNAMGRVVIPILHYVSSIIVIMWQWDGETLHMVICPMYQQVLTLIHTCTWFSSIPMTSMLARVYTWFSTIPLQRRRTFSPEALVSLYYV